MATKTISITVESYERLRIQKAQNESFSDVINRITGKKSLLELAGILSDDEANKLESYIKERGLINRRRMEKIKESLGSLK